MYSDYLKVFPRGFRVPKSRFRLFITEEIAILIPPSPLPFVFMHISPLQCQNLANLCDPCLCCPTPDDPTPDVVALRPRHQQPPLLESRAFIKGSRCVICAFLIVLRICFVCMNS